MYISHFPREKIARKDWYVVQPELDVREEILSLSRSDEKRTICE